MGVRALEGSKGGYLRALEGPNRVRALEGTNGVRAPEKRNVVESP
jgi:hypothetical protein